MTILDRLKLENYLNGDVIAQPEQHNEMMDLLETTHDSQNGVEACQNMSLGEQLQKENICPYMGVQPPCHNSVANTFKTLISDESSCGTSPMSDSDGAYSLINSENRMYVTDPIPISP